MDRPDFTRRQVVDRFFYEYGFDVYGDPHPDVQTGGTGFWRAEKEEGGKGTFLYLVVEVAAG